MKKIKILFIILISFVFLYGINVTVKADTGPKRYVQIEFDIEKTYYVTLLSKYEQFGPYSASYNQYEDDQIDLAFSNYQDEYYYFHYYKLVSKENNTYSWTYYPPTDFKVLIFDAENNNFIISETCQTYAFASIFKCDISDNKLILTKNSRVGLEIINLLIRMGVTLIIEVSLALIFRFRKQEILVIVIINVITQLALNIILNVTVHKDGIQIFALMMLMVILEIIIVVIETLSYIIMIPRIDNKHNLENKKIGLIMGYTLLANILSAFLGGLILMSFPV